MKYAKNILEEELKNRVGNDFFDKFNHMEIKGKIDFAVRPKDNIQENLFGAEYFLWAEAKAAVTDIIEMLTQLILTIGKAKTHEKINPPHFLGCFDREKIAFVPYYDIQEIFRQTDFNWNVTPSNHNTKEFKLVYNKIDKIISGKQTYVFNFSRDEKELKDFVKKNFVAGKVGTIKIQINKNNFKWVYDKWALDVKPSIDVDWDVAKKHKIRDADFYLADLISKDNLSIKQKLSVLLQSDHYVLDKKIDDMGLFGSKSAVFKDNQKAHKRFWAKYERPPKEEYWDYIIERHDLLVPQDIREREGSFYTPKIWVELSQKYLADVFGEDWQDEYYIWDCAAGTGNLLAGLTNKRRIWASTLDKADVDIMRDRIKNGANLFENHVFQFDFLNDEFKKLPKELQEVINDKEKRKKLIIYINPPYADASSNMKASRKEGNSFTKVHEKYKDNYLGAFARELFAQFLVRIYQEIPNCKIGIFSKLKLFSVNHAKKMQTWFKAKLMDGFIVPAVTFDNVDGNFPISFQIWNPERKENIGDYALDVFDGTGGYLGQKTVYNFNRYDKINDWIVKYNGSDNVIGYLSRGRNDFQNKSLVFIINSLDKATNSNVLIDKNNLIPVCIYSAVQSIPDANWLNDRDQFLCPADDWKKDTVFQNDCLAYTLFNGQNNISSKLGVNHWIPFTESEVGVHKGFDSSFMTDFIAGKIKTFAKKQTSLFDAKKTPTATKRTFSREAVAVFDAGRELWRYYHTKPRSKVNASLYDIREHFQGRNENGKMSTNSEDETYLKLRGNLRKKLYALAKKIEPKIYKYGFLKE